MPVIGSLRDRLIRECARTIDPQPLAASRILISIAALMLAPVTFYILSRLLDPSRMRVPTIPGLVIPLSSGLLTALGIIWILSAVLFLVGWRTRWAGASLFSVLAFAQVLDYQTITSYTYLLTLVVLLLTISESGASRSIDARRGGGRCAVPGWPARLLNVQLSLVYGFTALAKLNNDYLSGAILAEAWRGGGIASIPVDRLPAGALEGMAALSIGTEAFLAFGFWFRRLRPFALIVGIGLHMSIVLTMGNEYAFTLFNLVMLSLYATFFNKLPWPVRVKVSRDENKKVLD